MEAGRQVAVPCGACGSVPRASCVKCDGSGQVTKNACRRCDGTGSEVRVKGLRPTCADCHGAGYREIDNEPSREGGW